MLSQKDDGIVTAPDSGGDGLQFAASQGLRMPAIAVEVGMNAQANLQEIDARGARKQIKAIWRNVIALCGRASDDAS